MGLVLVISYLLIGFALRLRSSSSASMGISLNPLNEREFNDMLVAARNLVRERYSIRSPRLQR